MERNVILPDYPDIIPSNPGWTDEEFEKRVAEEMEKAKNLSEWPDI